MEILVKKDNYKISRVMYIIEALLEYFIALGIGADYLATLALEIGMSDALIGIIEAFVSLGATFRIFAVLLANKTPVKVWVTIMHVISQIFFAIIWFVPLFKVSQTLKTVLLISFLLIAYVLHNLIYPAKTNMYMECVDDHKRGDFTAVKEMVSLAGAMVFTNAYGNVIQILTDNGKKELAFVLCGVMLLVFMFGHTLTLVFVKEKVEVERKKVDVKQTFKHILEDKKVFLVMLVTVFYNIVNYSSTPFFASYRMKELEFSLSFVPIVTAIASIVRMCCSKPMGKIADKFSFSTMLTVCFSIFGLAYVVMMFTVPSNGKVMYIVYAVVHAIASAGITSGMLNLIYDYVDHDNRTAALAINGAMGGIAGFLASLAVSPLITFIQGNGNKFLGMNVYAQQVLAFWGVIGTLGMIAYNVFVVSKLKRNDDIENVVSNDVVEIVPADVIEVATTDIE